MKKHFAFRNLKSLTPEQRLNLLIENCGLSIENKEHIRSAISQEYLYLFNDLVENVIGGLSLPLGFVPNVHIDGKDYIVPMAIEETSVIAASSKTARWLHQKGQIHTQIIGQGIIGQIQIAKVKNLQNLFNLLEQHKKSLIQSANQTILSSLVKRGGGIIDLTIRHISRPDLKDMAIIHVILDPCDAMGANFVTQTSEYLGKLIEEITDEKVTMCIVSNLSDCQITKAFVTVHSIDEELAQKIEEASLFAELDPYRASTHNKGILNGIDPILIATGNDWRAVEAGLHAYAAKSGQYKPLSYWKKEGKTLTGTFEGPIMLGTVGGMTRLHPIAQQCLSILGITQSQELARVVASMGLIQNLGSLRALVGSGLTQGHMRLHIKNILLSIDALPEERIILTKHLNRLLKDSGKISLSDAEKYLDAFRAGNIL